MAVCLDVLPRNSWITHLASQLALLYRRRNDCVCGRRRRLHSSRLSKHLLELVKSRRGRACGETYGRRRRGGQRGQNRAPRTHSWTHFGHSRLESLVASLSFNAFFPTLSATLGYNRTVTLLLCAPPWVFATLVAFIVTRSALFCNNQFT